MSLVDDVVAFYERFYLAKGDSAQLVAAAEQRLGQPLPELLRAAYLRTGLRRSEQLHLLALGDLRVVGNVIVFATDQQGCEDYGVCVKDGGETDPRVYAGGAGELVWRDCALSRFLMLLWIVNRPFEPPYANVGLDARDLRGWEPFEHESELLGLSKDSFVFTDGLVYQTDADCLGARTNEGLRAFLEDNDEMECADICWATEA